MHLLQWSTLLWFVQSTPFYWLWFSFEQLHDLNEGHQVACSCSYTYSLDSKGFIDSLLDNLLSLIPMQQGIVLSPSVNGLSVQIRNDCSPWLWVMFKLALVPFMRWARCQQQIGYLHQQHCLAAQIHILLWRLKVGIFASTARPDRSCCVWINSS